MTMRADEPPFDDFRVRRAMQKALDLETISETYYGGYADVTPWGYAGPGTKGFFVPYAEWPEEIKEGYRYDPAEAERLLDEAGYERGPDGIRFKTEYSNTPAWADMDVAQILKQFWTEIGVDVQVNVLSGPAMGDLLGARGFKGMTMGEMSASLRFPTVGVKEWDWVGGFNDPEFNALLEKADSATELEDFKQYSKEVDMYFIQQHWLIWHGSLGNFVFYQPWLGNYNGAFPHENYNLIFSRTWIDQELKDEMGH